MEKQTLADFSLGAWEHTYTDMLQPRASLGQLTEGYVDESGIVRCRGKVSQRIAAAMANPGSFAFAGMFLGGFREIVLDYDAATQLGNLRVIDAAGTAYGSVDAALPTEANSCAVVGNLLHIGNTSAGSSGGSTGSPAPVGAVPVAYGGARKPQYPSPGLIAMVAGSPVINCPTALFLANVDVGMIVVTSTVVGGFAVVKSIQSNTQLTLDRPSVFTGNSGYPFQRFANVPGTLPAGEFRFGQVGGRLLHLQRAALRFSSGPDPATGSPRTGDFPAANVHEFPVDAAGSALATVRDRVFVFTEAGVFIVSGMAYEIVDGSGNPQHPIELLSTQLVAIGQRGIVSWGNAIIVPCRDGIYAIDGIGAPVKISRGIPFAEMVRDGLEIGWAAVYKGRYLLPYLYGGQRHMWTFRLDGKDSEQGLIFPVSTFSSLPTGVRAVAKSGADSLLAVGDAAHGVSDMGEVFTATTDGLDWDASTAGGGFTMKTAPIALGDKAVVRRVRVRYSFLVGTGTVTPTLNATVASIRDGSDLDSTGSVVMVQGFPPAVLGTRWAAIDLPGPLEADAVRVTLSLTGAHPKDFIVHAVEVQYRAFGGR